MRAECAAETSRITPSENHVLRTGSSTGPDRSSWIAFDLVLGTHVELQPRESIAGASVLAAGLATASIASRGSDAGGDATPPDIAALAGPLADQEISWEACEFSDDGPPLPGADLSNVECATIQVPRDWKDPDPEATWDVRISQARNIDPADPDYDLTIIIEFTACTDGQWTQGQGHWTAFNERTAEVAPLTAQLGLLVTPSCAFWPTDSTMPPLTDAFPETIVLQSEPDSMTPFEQGRAAGTGLPNTSLIAVDNESIHGVFPYGTDAVDQPVLDFLAGGDRPTETIVAPAKPLPLEETTYESWTPLDRDAEHATETPQFTDPTISAETATLSEVPAP